MSEAIELIVMLERALVKVRSMSDELMREIKSLEKMGAGVDLDSLVPVGELRTYAELLDFIIHGIAGGKADE